MAAEEWMPHRFTADEFERMSTVGLLDEDDRIELIDGELIEMAAVNVKHANCVGELTLVFARLLPRGVKLRVQDSVRLNDIRQLQPDLLLIEGKKYTAIPTPADVLLLIEVSDSSLAYDRGKKMFMYAMAGITEYWIANVNEQVVERFAEPRSGVYTRHDIAQTGDILSPLSVPEIAIPVADIWE